MGLKHRVDRLEERLNPHGEKVAMTFLYRVLPDNAEWVPEPFRPGHNPSRLFSVSRYLTVVFTSGSEEQQRAELKRLRRDPRYQTDPCANRPKAALAADHDAGKDHGWQE